MKRVLKLILRPSIHAAFGLCIALLGVSAHASGITYIGRLLNSDSTPVTDSAVQFQMEILTPDSQACVMYEETQTKNLSATSGVFSITINDGSGTRSDSSGLSFSQVFANYGTFSFSPSTCSSGTGSYSPAITDNRGFLVSFKTSTMSSFESLAEQSINFSPLSIESEQVSGFPAASLVRVADPSLGPQSVSALTPAQFTALQALINGTSTNYVQAGTNGAPLPAFTANPSSSSAGDVWFNSTTGTIDYNNGSGVQAIGTGNGSGTVTQVNSGTGLSGGPITSSGTLAVNVGTSAGQIVQVQTGGALPALDGSNLTNLNGSSISSGTIGGTTSMNSTGTIQITSISSTTDSTDNLWIYGGTHKVEITAPSSLSADYSLVLPSGEPAGNGYVLTSDTSGNLSWSAPGSGSGSVTSVGLTDSSTTPIYTITNSPVTSSGTLTMTLSSQSANQFFAGPATGSAQPTFRAIASSDLPSGAYDTTYFKNGGNSFSAPATLGTNDSNTLSLQTHGSAALTIDTSQRVGIGTSSPSSALDVNGAIRFEGSTSGYSTLQSPAVAGNVAWTLPSADGSANQVLQTNGLGQLSWASPGSGGTVTSISAGSGISTGGSSITTTGTISLASIGSGDLLANTSGASAAPADTTLTALIDKAIGNVQGDLLYRSSSAWTVLTPGSAGQVLQSGGTSANPSWATASAGSVTSVGLSMPAIFSVSGSPVTSSGTLAVTASGMAGGIPYFSSSTALSSSGTLGEYQVLLGGGAGNSPTTVSGTGTSGYVLTSNGSSSAPTWQAAGSSSQWTTSGNNIYSSNSGNVGIGTSAPAAALHVAAPLSSNALQIDAAGASSVFSVNFQGTSLFGSASLGVGSGGSLVNLSSSSVTSGGAMLQINSGLGSDTSSYLIRGQNNGAEIFNVMTSGNVGIGSTSPAYPLDVVGDIRTSTCLHYASSNLGTCSSDERLKKDIRPFDLGLDTVIGLQPKYFRYNGLGGEPESKTDQMGFIAQDVEKVAPSLISSKKVLLHPNDRKETTIKTVNYGAFIYMAINAIKELYADWTKDSKNIHLELAAKDREIASLKQENTELKQQVIDQGKDLKKIKEKLGL